MDSVGVWPDRTCPVLLIDDNGRIASADNAAARLLGMADPGHLVGRRVCSLALMLDLRHNPTSGGDGSAGTPVPNGGLGMRSTETAIASSITASPAGTETVLGRIDTVESDLDAAIRAWQQNLAARGRRRTTIDNYLRTLKRAIQDRGWAFVADVTESEMLAWITESNAEHGWKTSTYNRATCALASFGEYLQISDLTARNPSRRIQRARNTDGSLGARSLSTDEARRLVRTAWLRQQADMRARGDRPLVWAMLLLAGMRHGEIGRLQIRHVRLDDAIPHLAWDTQSHKSATNVDVPLHPQLIRCLRRHVATLEHRCDNDPLFPVQPTKNSFALDRERAGIASHDHRGRPVTPHSCRKWFATELARAGVNATLVSQLMRHSGGLAARYADVDLAGLAAEIAKLPPIWPEDDPDFRGDEHVEKPPDPENSSGSDLTPEEHERTVGRQRAGVGWGMDRGGGRGGGGESQGEPGRSPARSGSRLGRSVPSVFRSETPIPDPKRVVLIRRVLSGSIGSKPPLYEKPHGKPWGLVFLSAQTKQPDHDRWRSRSRISVSRTSCADGATGAAGAASFSFSKRFFAEFISLITTKIASAIITKSMIVLKNEP